MNADLTFAKVERLADSVGMARLDRLARDVTQIAGLRRLQRECERGLARTKRRATKAARWPVLDEKVLKAGQMGYRSQQTRLEVEWRRQRSAEMNYGPWGAKAYETK